MPGAGVNPRMLQLNASWLLLMLSVVALASCQPHRPHAPVQAGMAQSHAAKAASSKPASAVRLPSRAPADAPPSPLLPDLPEPIALAGKRACSLSTLAFRATNGGRGSELRLRAGGPVFARVDRGKVAVTVPEGKAEAALIEASSDGVIVSGIADSASITFFPAKPFIMEGLVVPAGSAELTLTAASEDAVRFKLALPAEVVVPKGTLEETRPCGDIGIDPSTFDSKTPVFGTRNGSHLLMSGGLAELTSHPAGARAATLRIPAGGKFVSTFDEQQGRTLIGWQTSTLMVFGWVRSARLQHSNVGIGLTGLRGFGRSGGKSVATVASVRCEADLPLIGEADGEARTVGRILAGTTVRVAKWGDPRSRVVVEAAGIHEEHGRFSVRTAELRACRDLAPVTAR